MSMAFHVILRRNPQRDLDEQTEWLKRTRSVAAADRWRASLIATPLPNLESDPCRYPQAYEAQELGVDLRVLLHRKRPHVYRVLFTTHGQTVNVLGIQHAAQDHFEDWRSVETAAIRSIPQCKVTRQEITSVPPGAPREIARRRSGLGRLRRPPRNCPRGEPTP